MGDARIATPDMRLLGAGGARLADETPLQRSCQPRVLTRNQEPVSDFAGQSSLIERVRTRKNAFPNSAHFMMY